MRLRRNLQKIGNTKYNELYKRQLTHLALHVAKQYVHNDVGAAQLSIPGGFPAGAGDCLPW